MCLIDSKELERIVKTHDSSKDLANMVNQIIARLVDEGYYPDMDSDPFEYPRVVFIRKEVL